MELETHYDQTLFTIDENLRIEILDRLISIKHSLIKNKIVTYIDYDKLIQDLIKNFNINDTLNIIYSILDDTILGVYPVYNHYTIYSSEIENMINKIDSTCV